MSDSNDMKDGRRNQYCYYKIFTEFVTQYSAISKGTWKMDQKKYCCQRMFYVFLFKSFIVSSLIFRPLVHFELIFVCGTKEYSNFILLQVAVQFSQHHLLKRLCFHHLKQPWTCILQTLGWSLIFFFKVTHMLRKKRKLNYLECLKNQKKISKRQK